ANTMNYWDMGSFHEREFGTTATQGIGKGAGTVTVDGKVFDQQAVNYWLGGLIWRELEFNSYRPDATEMSILGYGHIYGQEADRHDWAGEDTGDEKAAWFEAGKKLDPTLPQSPSWLKDEGKIKGHH